MTSTDIISSVDSGSVGCGSSPVTPSDTNNLSDLKVARSLYVTTAGDVCFVGADGNTDTWTVPANFYIRVAVKQVKATGTTASGIKAIW